MENRDHLTSNVSSRVSQDSAKKPSTALANGLMGLRVGCGANTEFISADPLDAI